MKKVVLYIILSIFLAAVIFAGVFSKIKLEEEKKEVVNLNKKISNTKQTKEKKLVEIEKNKKEIENLKVSLKDKIEEEEIWNQITEKINHALSS